MRRNAILNKKNIDAECFYGVVWHEFASKVILLQVSCGILGRRGTPVENH